MTQIVTGMKYLHQHSILHRDLSLTNLLLTRGMDVKIADFGLAAQLTGPSDQHYTMCGTPNYISPWVFICILYMIYNNIPYYYTSIIFVQVMTM